MLRGIGRLRAKASAGGVPAAGATFDGVLFDGSTRTLLTLTGVSDSKLVTVAGWVAFDTLSAAGTIMHLGLGTAGSGRFQLLKTAADEIQIIGRNAAIAAILDVKSAAHSATATWFQIAGSFDLSDTGKRHLYVNGASELTVTTYTDDVMAFNDAVPFVVGARSGGASAFSGGMAQLAWWPGVYVDLSNPTNLAKFITVGGDTVGFGSDASTPTGSAAAVFLNLADGAAAANFVTNAGTGGTPFVTTGTLATYSTSPSD